MRISDWSSDVCSSDLVWIEPGQPDDSVTVHFGHGRTRAGRLGTKTGFNAYALRSSENLWSGRGLEVVKTGRRPSLACTQPDRKSVVWGKSVSVSVNLGGRLYIKKKKKKTNRKL